VLGEIARVVRGNGVLIVSSPNQASLENRVRLLKGKSILEMPDEIESAKGVFGHIRLYTPTEMKAALQKLGFRLECSHMETNISGYRGKPRGWRRRMYQIYEGVEERVGLLRGLGDTWYLGFRKNSLKVGSGKTV
jgi:hypothetical protein